MIIGLFGPAQCGKSTIAKHLVNKYEFTEYAFATALKELLKNTFSLTEDEVNTQEGKATIIPEFNKTPREMLQIIGSAFRKVYDNYWVDVLMLGDIDYAKNNGYSCVISDVRYPNEIEAILNEDAGYIIKIGKTSGSKLEGKEALHESESYFNIDMSKYDSSRYTLVSAAHGEIEYLLKQVDSFIDNITRYKIQ